MESPRVLLGIGGYEDNNDHEESFRVITSGCIILLLAVEKEREEKNEKSIVDGKCCGAVLLGAVFA